MKNQNEDTDCVDNEYIKCCVLSHKYLTETFNLLQLNTFPSNIDLLIRLLLH